MLNNIKKQVTNTLLNLPGWHTHRKIVVIESDDWGSIRMPSKEVYEKLLKAGIQVDKCPYNRYDSLASEDDLSALFDVLTRFFDKNGNHPIFTANSVVANPDFEKIKQSDFSEYFYEPFTKTLEKYPSHHNAFDLWMQGMHRNIFHPQFHGREHVNISFWLRALQQNNPTFRIAFDHGLWGLGPLIVQMEDLNIQAALDTKDSNDIAVQENILIDGINLFEKVFGYKSESFIATNFIWSNILNEVLSKYGIKTVQGAKYQLLPKLNYPKREKIRHWVGEINNKGQVYLVRNCVFEPSQEPGCDSVASCLKEINNAFLWGKPAIITSHRLNYIGFIDEKNRYNNLIGLQELIKSVLKHWPDVEFMTSDNLGRLIQEDMNHFQ